MKRLIVLLCMVLLAGCAGPSKEIEKKGEGVAEGRMEVLPAPNRVQQVGKGDIFLEEINYGTPKGLGAGVGYRKTWRILEIKDNKISIRYSEWKADVDYKAETVGLWKIRPGFGREFVFPLVFFWDNKLMSVAGYDFEIMSLDKGMMSYKRIESKPVNEDTLVQ